MQIKFILRNTMAKIYNMRTMCIKDRQYEYKQLKKNTDYCRQNATKGCHGQTAESQAGTSKGKLSNAKLLATSLT